MTFQLSEFSFPSGQRLPPSGHQVRKAIHGPTSKHMLVKDNKHGKSEFSQWEIMFNVISNASLQIKPIQGLVYDGQRIAGLAIEHLDSAIERLEGQSAIYYRFNNQKNQVFIPQSKIPLHFLDHAPQGYLAQLKKLEQEEKISIDYSSLANILVTSYVLEEDDLHRGNFGFYSVKKRGKPYIKFFKIDHDLMFVDSLMGYRASRPFHLAHGARAFAPTAKDILHFPLIKDTANSYWPTKFGYISNHLNNKEFLNFADINFFSSLKDNEEFNKHKWKEFYRHLLLSQQRINEELKTILGEDNAFNRAERALVMQALTARLSSLRAVLFSIPEFCQFIQHINRPENQSIYEELLTFSSEEKINADQRFIQTFLASESEEKGYSPLHLAILAGDYRYEDSLRMFKQHLNRQNAEGKTPLDIALELIDSEYDKPEDCRQDMRGIIKHLLEVGAKTNTSILTREMVLAFQAHQLINPALSKITPETNLNDLVSYLRELGEAHRFSLKTQKKMAVATIKQWIHVHRPSKPELANLHDIIHNSYVDKEACAGVKYLRQLRSELWFIRQLRGPYGKTTTLLEINKLLINPPKQPSPGRFFSTLRAGVNGPAAAESSLRAIPA